jgi:hypothetical protein
VRDLDKALLPLWGNGPACLTGRAHQGRPILKRKRGMTVKRLGIALVVFLVLACISPSGYAAEGTGNPPGADSPTPPAAAKTPADDRLPIHKQDEWQFFLSPYMWITGVNANLTSLKKTTHTIIPWWDTASALFTKTIGVMGRAEVWKGRWGVFLDGYFTYVGMSDRGVGASQEQTFGPVDFTVNKQANLGGVEITVPIPGKIGGGNLTLTPSGSVKYISRIGNLDLGARFLVGAWPLSREKPLPTVSLEILGGTRLNSINQYMRINLSAIKVATVPIDIGGFSLTGKYQQVKNGSLVIDYNNQYVEPFLGARLGLWLSPKFVVNLKGDVGGFGFVGDDHVDCNLEALLGYRVSQHVYAWAGYRAHGAWYNFGADLVQINLAMWAHGPVLGVTYAF